MEGVLVTGTAHAALDGECARCLEPISDEIEVTVPGAVRVRRRPDLPDDEDDEVSMLEGDLLDLEPLLRDAVVLALPFQPLCEDDCPGLCTECGARLADDPDHAHDAPIDPRWAGLTALTQDQQDPKPEQHPTAGEPVKVEEKNSGCPEAEDVAQQHAAPSFGRGRPSPRAW